MKLEFIYIVLFIALTVSCGSNEKDPEIKIEPQFLNSHPTDGESNVSELITSIELFFNENITLVTPHGITLNGNPILEARPGIQKNLKISLPTLKSSTTYTLLIPQNKVKGPSGILISKEIKVTFTTESPSERAYSQEAQNVMNYLKSVYGKKTISGTMAKVNWNIEEAEWVHTQTGKYPALNCFDFIHHVYSPANWIDYSNTTVVENWWSSNGLVAAMWHWNVPANSGQSGEYSFYYGNKPEETLFDVRKISDPNSSEYKLMIKDIDNIAGYLKLLQDKNIPVIWRPLHEAAGNTNSYPGGRGWFWWGANGPEACIELWRFMFDRMTNHHGLNNLIWVWTIQGNDPDWYPGDDYVDIVGTDIYPETNIHDSQIVQFNKIKSIVNNKKMIALSECGGIPDPNKMFEKGDTWLWFMPWYGDHTRDNKNNGLDYWRTIMDNQYVITRDEMPNLK